MFFWFFAVWNFYSTNHIPGPPVRTYRTNSGAYRKARVASSIKQGRVKSSRSDPLPGDQSTTGENPNPPTNQIQPPILVSQSDQPTKIDDNNNNNTEKVMIFVHNKIITFFRIKFGADCWFHQRWPGRLSERVVPQLNPCAMRLVIWKVSYVDLKNDEQSASSR